MGNAGTVEQFTIKSRNPSGQASGNGDGQRRRNTGAETANADNPGIGRRRTESITVETPGPAAGDSPIFGGFTGDIHTETAARNLGEKSADEPRKRGRPPGSRNSTRKAQTVNVLEAKVSAEHIKKYTVSTFGLIASLTKREHWRVNRPDIEIDPWADDMATLLNNLPAQYADMLGRWGAAYVVAVGLGGMVAIRLRLDNELIKRERNAINPTPNPRGNRLVTQEDLQATTEQPYHAPAPSPDIQLPGEGDTRPISPDSLWRIYEHQKAGATNGATEATEGTRHNLGKGGADPLTPNDLRGILA